MNSSNNFKLVWWAILVIVIGLFLYGRYDELLAGKSSYFDTVVFLVWISVCLAPIFKEMNIFGVKLKQDINELKKDISHQLSILKTEIKSSIEVSSANSNQINFNTSPEPLKDSEIPDITAQLHVALNKMGISTDKESVETKVDEPQIPVEMFKVRLSFEKLLKNHALSSSLASYSYNRKLTVGKLLYNLREVDWISKEIVLGSQEVISICNYAIHGEKLTDAQISFVRESAPGLLKALKRELSSAL
jgi:hypothetical protein